ncbi:MAG TPA: PPC domain-containing DNA-binding protein [Symbiobacteriaceae bacterium]|jgi:hypothetical protein
MSTPFPKFVWARLEPGVDPITGIAAVIEELGADSGSIVQCMGSLDVFHYMIAVPDAEHGFKYSAPMTRTGPMEFLSTQGSWGRDIETGELVVHMHGMVIDAQGQPFGGHLIPGGSRTLATVEVALITGEGVQIRRTFDRGLGVPVLMPATAVPQLAKA